MNRKIGMISSGMNVLSVLMFAASTIAGISFFAYASSIFIGLSFVAMISAYCVYSRPEVKAAEYCALSFAVMYAAMIILVYYAQITTVRTAKLSGEAEMLLNYEKMGLFFNYNLFGYGIMALSTFFAGFLIQKQNAKDKILSRMLMIHGVFFIACFLLPLLQVFNPNIDGVDLIGRLILLIWCIYFIPIGILSVLYFRRQEVAV